MEQDNGNFDDKNNLSPPESNIAVQNQSKYTPNEMQADPRNRSEDEKRETWSEYNLKTKQKVAGSLSVSSEPPYDSSPHEVSAHRRDVPCAPGGKKMVYEELKMNGPPTPTLISTTEHDRSVKALKSEVKSWRNSTEIEKKECEALQVENEELNKEKSTALSERTASYMTVHKMSEKDEETHDKLKKERELKRSFEREKNILEKDLKETKEKIPELEDEIRRLSMELNKETESRRKVENDFAELQDVVNKKLPNITNDALNFPKKTK